jgi:tripartite-type tricarboxylate transporter receptor subunit TctC
MIVGPKGIPDEVTEKLVPAIRKAYNSDEYKKFMKNRGFGMVWRGPDEAYKFMEQADHDLGAVMKKAGLAKQ